MQGGTGTSNRTTAIGIFLLAFGAFAWLAPQRPCWIWMPWCSKAPTENVQVVTRLGLTLSIVESGRLDIDRFADRTIDKAVVKGHYYADKVPGLSFLAIPVVAATALVINATGGAVNSNKPADFARFAKVASIAINGLISALATAVLFLTAIRLGATRTGALFAAGALAFATPFFGWSTAFLAHSVSGSLLMFVAAAIAFAFAGDRAGQSRPPSMLFGLGLGMLLGYTIVVDLTAAPACLLGGVLTLALAARLGAAALFRMASGLVLGGVLGLLPLLVYNQLAFGSPFTLGYSAVVGFEGMQQGFFGITWPKPAVARGTFVRPLSRPAAALSSSGAGPGRSLCDVARAEHARRGGCDSLRALLIPLDQCELLLLGWWRVDRATPSRTDAASLLPRACLRLAARLLGPDSDAGPAGCEPCPVLDLRSSGHVRALRI